MYIHIHTYIEKSVFLQETIVYKSYKKHAYRSYYILQVSILVKVRKLSRRDEAKIKYLCNYQLLHL